MAVRKLLHDFQTASSLRQNHKAQQEQYNRAYNIGDKLLWFSISSNHFSLKQCFLGARGVGDKWARLGASLYSFPWDAEKGWQQCLGWGRNHFHTTSWTEFDAGTSFLPTLPSVCFTLSKEKSRDIYAPFPTSYVVSVHINILAFSAPALQVPVSFQSVPLPTPALLPFTLQGVLLTIRFSSGITMDYSRPPHQLLKTIPIVLPQSASQTASLHTV